MKMFKRIKTLFLSLVIVVAAVFCGFAMTACNDGNSGNENGGNGDSNGGTGNEIVTPEKPLALTTSVETNENGENTYTINAIVNPSTLTPRWAIVWEDSTSEWAQDKDTADYFNLELSNGDKTAKLSTKQAFGETALLTATISSPTGDVSVSKKVDYNFVREYKLITIPDEYVEKYALESNSYYIVTRVYDRDLYSVGFVDTYNGIPVRGFGNGLFASGYFATHTISEFTIPSFITRLYFGCFYRAKIGRLVIPSTVKAIEGDLGGRSYSIDEFVVESPYNWRARVTSPTDLTTQEKIRVWFNEGSYGNSIVQNFDGPTSDFRYYF